MTLKINPPGVAHALHLVKTGHYTINTIWENNRPTEAQQQAYQAENGEDELARWYLARDDDGYTLPHGDFRRVHRSAVVAAKRAAEAQGLPELVAAADEILDLFDRMNAC
ncbi:MAG: hypothetical protein NZM00_03470 [Anaerolinea sp.]|nr:hypothetical protein [Anaerolinea sp.]